MMRKQRQVLLEKNGRQRVVWIPAPLAKRGSYVRLLDEDGWRVAEVYQPMEAKFIQARSRDYRTQRSVSDV